MIFITARFHIEPEHADRWPEIASELTEGTRSEEGCLWYDWYRSVDDPNVYVVVEAFKDDRAAGAHVNSEHFVNARKELPQYLARTPEIVNFTVDQDDWSELGEMRVA